MCSPAVLDKDGVSAAAIAGEFVSYLASKNMTLSHQLRSIYEEYVTKTSALTSLMNYVLNLFVNHSFHIVFFRYGYHISKNSYFICHNQDTIKQMFERLRNYDGENSYPKACGGFAITAARDLTTGYDSNQQDNKAVRSP